MPEGRTIDRSANWAQLNTINDSLMHSHGEPSWFEPPATADSSLVIDQTAASDFRLLKYKPPYLYYYRRFRP